MDGWKFCISQSDFEMHIVGNIHDGSKAIQLCCDMPDRPRMAFADTPEETLERFIGMRTLAVSESVFRCHEQEAHPYTHTHTHTGGVPLRLFDL